MKNKDYKSITNNFDKKINSFNFEDAQIRKLELDEITKEIF